MSSHFMPPPLKSMIRASSSGDHLLCFLAGDSAGWGGMLRLPPAPVLARAYEGGSGCPLVDGTDVDRVWCLCVGEDDADSLESGALRRREISTVTVYSCRCRSRLIVHMQ